MSTSIREMQYAILAQRNKRIIEMSREGKSRKEIAEHFGVSIATVTSIRAEVGFTVRNPPPDPDQIVKLTLKGLTLKEIAEELGCNKRTVSRWRVRRKCLTKESWRPFTEDEKLRAKELLEGGCSYVEVGRTLGRCQGTIAHHFPGMGWTEEQTGEYVRLQHQFRKLLNGD